MIINMIINVRMCFINMYVRNPGLWVPRKGSIEQQTQILTVISLQEVEVAEEAAEARSAGWTVGGPMACIRPASNPTACIRPSGLHQTQRPASTLSV